MVAVHKTHIPPSAATYSHLTRPILGSGWSSPVGTTANVLAPREICGDPRWAAGSPADNSPTSPVCGRPQYNSATHSHLCTSPAFKVICFREYWRGKRCTVVKIFPKIGQNFPINAGNFFVKFE